MAMVNGIASDVWLAGLPSVTMGASPETCDDSGDHIVYYAHTHKAWDKNHPVTLEQSANGSSGWSDVAAADYTFAYPIGRVTFESARTVGVNNYIRIKASTGYYYTITQLDECHAWSLSQKANIVDTTPFQATGGYKRKTLTNKDADGKVDTYRTDGTCFAELGSMTVMRLYIDKAGGDGFVFYAWVTGIEPKSDATNVIEQTISFTCEGEVYFSTDT